MDLLFVTRSVSIYFIFIFSLLFTVQTTAQIGINTTDPKAMLDVESDDSGILIPRVSLVRTTDADPVVSPQHAELVFNLATVNDVTPGFYYWNGSIWVRLSAGGGSTGGDDDKWDLSGNSGTTPGDNFLGTKDNNALHIKTANTTRLIFPTENQIHATNRGSEDAPFYSFADDPDTGLFSPAADFVSIATNGKEHFRVGNDKIPPLRYIRSYLNHRFADGTAPSPGITFNDNTNLGLYRINSNIMGIATGGAERMRISNEGVGINLNTNPTERLQVNGNIRFDGALKPNNQAGNLGQVLLSTGNNQAPEWGAEMGTVSVIYQAQTELIPELSYGYIGVVSVGPFPPGVLTNDATVSISIKTNVIGSNTSFDIKIHSIVVSDNYVEFGWSNIDPYDDPTNYQNVMFNITIIR